MHRVSRTALFHTIYTVITCSRLKRRTGGRQIHASLETQEGQSAVTELICNAIDNDSKMVIAAEMIGEFHKRHGKWGVDEPLPAAVPEPPRPSKPGADFDRGRPERPASAGVSSKTEADRGKC